MDSITIRIPPPPKGTAANARCGHYMQRAAAVKRARRTAWACALHALDGRTPPQWTRATVRVDRVMGARQRRMDPDNVLSGLKGTLDGIVDAGIIVNDRDLDIAGITQRRADAGELAGYLLTLSPL